MITTDPNFRILNDTSIFTLGHVFECVYLVNKETLEQDVLGELYGDPIWGLISNNSDWAIVGGQSLILWQEPNYIVHIEDPELVGSIKGRQTSPNELEILIDPWSDNSAVWLLNVDSLLIRKLATRDKLTSSYSEDIDW